jgi:hypothetical protein
MISDCSFSNCRIVKLIYSVLKLFTGFAITAFTDWKLMVIRAIKISQAPVVAKTQH